MRPVLYCDVSAAARVLMRVPQAHREERCAGMIERAQVADRFVKRLGRIHPVWGNGTLLAVARRHPIGPEPSFDDAAFCDCFEMVLKQLRLRRADVKA